VDPLLVLDNSVVDDCDLARLRHMRVRVHVVRLSMGGPAGVRDPIVRRGLGQLFPFDQIAQVGDLARRLLDQEPDISVVHAYTRAVVATVL